MPIESNPDRPSAPAEGEARRAAGDVAEGASSLAGEAGRQAREAAAAGKDAATGSLERLADALHTSTRELSDREHWFAEAAESTAEGLRTAARRLKDQDMEGVAAEAVKLARRHPAMFVGGAVALGFALSRIAKADVGRVRERREGSRAWTGESGYGGSHEHAPVR